MSDFVHLHTHSDYSILQGISRTSAIIAHAADCGHSAVALTDTSTMFGAMEFYKGAKSYNDKHDRLIRPIIGCELKVSTDGVSSLSRSDLPYTQLVLLCRDEEGYHSLVKLVSLSYLKSTCDIPMVSRSMLEKHRDGLLALSGGIPGEVSTLLLQGDSAGAESAACWYRDLFGADNFYLEIQNHGRDEERRLIAANAALSKKTGIRLVATNDVHYLNKEDSYDHEILMCIADKTLIKTEKGTGKGKRRFLPGSGYHYKTYDEMFADFSTCPEALQATVDIAARCDLVLAKPKPHMPRIDIPDGLTAIAHLREECLRRLQDRMGEVPADYIERMDYELGVIKEMGFPDYFLIVADFVNYAKEQGILVGPGRGSAAGSLVSYAMGITNLDPIEYGLLFERFLNPERVNLPDVDIDFQDNRREEVIDYIRKKYGADHICQIITYGKLKPKAVLKDVARVFDIEFGIANKLSALIENAKSLDVAMKEKPRFKDEIIGNPVFQEILHHSRKLEGLTRQTGIHAAGVIIADKPVDEYAPLYCDPEDPEQVCTQYEHGLLEGECGLVKMDFLGLKTLSLIDKVVKLIKKNHNLDIDIDNIPLDDMATFELLSAGNALGIFQFESEGMRKYLKELIPNSIMDLTAMNAMYRPGPISWIPVYIARKHGQQPKYDNPENEQNNIELEKLVAKHKVLEDILMPTNLIPIYQEQVMEIGRAIAGFSLGGADLMRRAMGKKKVEVLVEIKKDFIKGAARINMTEEEADFLFEKIIMPFSGYGFNKSHAACYAMIAYQTAYLKANYTAEFMASLLNSEVDNTDKIRIYMDECRALGLKVQQPDVNLSDIEFTTDGKSIVYGLAAIKGVGTAAGGVIREERKQGDYSSFPNFLSRITDNRINKQVVEQLIKSGAFDSLGLTPAQLMAVYPELSVRISEEHEMAQGGQVTLFEEEKGRDDNYADLMAVAEKKADDPVENKNLEKEGLGFNIKYDLISKYSRELSVMSSEDTGKRNQWSDGKEIQLAGMVAQIRQIVTRKGDDMAFVKLENSRGWVDVTIFPRVFSRYNGSNPKNGPSLLEEERLILVKGKIQKNEKGVNILANQLFPFDPVQAPKPKPKQLHIQFTEPRITEAQLARLREMLTDFYGGACAVFLHFIRENNRRVTLEAENFKIDPSDLLKNRLSAVNFVNKYWFH